MKHNIFTSLGIAVIGLFFVQCTTNRSTEYQVLNTVEEMAPVLEKVLDKLATVQNVEYTLSQRFWNEWEDEPETWDRIYRCIVAYNAEDPFTNAKFVYWNTENGNYVFGYDGIKRIRPYRDDTTSTKVFEVDYRFNHPEMHRVRVVSNPFFYEIGDILEYTLNTSDSIQVQLTEDSDNYIFELMTLDPGVIVEFGIGHLDPHGIIPPGIGIDETQSLYRVKINKADMLPFDLEEWREKERMNRYVVSDIKPLDDPDFDIEKSLPEGYTFYNSPEREPAPKEVINTPLPIFTATDTEGKQHSGKDYLGKVLLLEHTSIGCGACQLAVPVLKELYAKYPKDRFEILALDAWGEHMSDMKGYRAKKDLPYPFALEDQPSSLLDELGNTTHLAPWFTIVNPEGIIVKTIKGFNKDELLSTIGDLLE